MKLKEEFITGAEASHLLGMRHSHITNLQNQGIIKPYYFGKDDKKVRLFNKKEVLKLVLQWFDNRRKIPSNPYAGIFLQLIGLH